MQAHGFSVYEMVMAADPVVKLVMLLLVIASIACWAIVFEKIYRLMRLKSDLSALEGIARDQRLAQNSSGLASTVLDAAYREIDEGAVRGESRSDTRARLEKAMKGTLKSELQSIETGLPFLATIGSAAPFIGLFGTVWGIMNSFAAIAQKQDTSLATVAPGIAEALFATALGLAAAIPAVMAYNHFAVKLGRAAARGNTAANEIAKNMSRSSADTVHSSTVEPIGLRKTY